MMKRLLLLLALLIGQSLSAFAQVQSKLPPCPAVDFSQKTDQERFAKWSNCWGRYKIELDAPYKDDVLEGEWLNGWLHGQGTYTHANGDKYVGEYKDGKPHGQGTYTYANGGKYVGEFKDGKYYGKGKGTATFNDGAKYEGEYKDGKWHGIGTATFANGEKYVGDWKEGKYSGQGTFTFANGDKYVGEYKDGKPHGQGTYNFANGEKYVGDWKEGKYSGQGTYTFPNGDKYVGEYKDGKPHGQGTYTYANGGKYLGEFKDGKFYGKGKGTYTFANGNKYEGEYKDGKEHGIGTATFANGEKYVGDWKEGRYYGNGKFTLTNGDKYVGGLKNGKIHGQGTYTFANGNKYVGEFKDEKYNGQGSSFSNGESYVGEFKDGKYNGQGSVTLPNGEKYVGEFKDNNYNGQGTYTFANDGKYVGEFKDGKYHGKGIGYLADGRVEEGIWVDGKFVRAEKINLPPINQQTDVVVHKDEQKISNGNVLEIKSILPPCVGSYYTEIWNNCFGTAKLPSNTTYVGEFKNHQWTVGKLTFSGGDGYVGEWNSRKYHGKGVEFYADGRPSKEGIWENDKFIRKEKIELSNLGQKNDNSSQQLSEERNRREQAKQSSKLSLQTATTNPDANGVVIISVRTNADTSSLKINGEEQGGRPDGIYTIKRVARVGQDTQFTITAVDIIGNTDSTTITVARQAVSQSSNQTASLKPESIKRAASRDAVAIIIGIQNYKRVPKAEFANADAKEFYEYAIRGLGIKPENIKLLVDEEADEVELYKAFQNWLPLQVTKNKTDVYVFYSGHGLPAPDGKSLYFLPHGVDKQFIEKTAVSQQEVIAALVASKPKSVTMFIDSCYSGQTRSGEMMIASVRPLAVKSEVSVYPSNFTVISASSNDQYSSSSPELKHGIFSFYLMKGMEGDADGNKDGKITAGEMQEYLQDKVSRQAMSMSRKQDTQLVGDANRVLLGR